MTGFKVNSSDRNKIDDKNAGEILETVLKYVKTETLKPIRGAGRWIGFGLVAALMLSIGLVLGALGILRLVQTSGLGDSSSWSWLTYVISSSFLLIISQEFPCESLILQKRKRRYIRVVQQHK